MLKIDGWEKVFSKTRSQGAVSSELYVDSCIRTQLNFEAKYSQLRSFETGGSQLVWQTPSGNKSFLSSSIDPETLIHLISNTPTPFAKKTETESDRSLRGGSDSHKLLEQACRKTLLAQSGIIEFKACYEESLKEFIFANEERGVSKGFETSGCLTAQFTVGNGIKQKKFRVKKGRTDIPSLISELQESWLPRYSLDKALQQPWPAPKGKVPVLWSSSCIAKLTLSLLWIIETQCRKLDAIHSLESHLSGFGFQIIDNWKHLGNRDVEGQDRQPTLLLDGGKLVCPLHPKSSGFSRRENHQACPITAPWEPALFGIERSHQLLKEMDQGISVHEIELLSIDPKTGNISFEIQEASLIHQGMEGEHMEPLRLKLCLFDLLRSFKLFSEENSPEPLIWSQMGQELFVEVTAPQALSASLELPGSAPLHHYW